MYVDCLNNFLYCGKKNFSYFLYLIFIDSTYNNQFFNYFSNLSIHRNSTQMVARKLENLQKDGMYLITNKFIELKDSYVTSSP